MSKGGSSQVALVVKNPLGKAKDKRDIGSIPDQEDPLEEGTATTPVFLPGEEPGGLQSMGSQRVRHDRSD